MKNIHQDHYRTRWGKGTLRTRAQGALAPLQTLVFLCMLLMAMVPAATSASSIFASPDNTGLVGYWSFDANTINGTTVKDLSGNKNNGTMVGSPTPTTGILNQALNFNGTSNYVALNYKNIGPTISYSAWIKLSSTSGPQAIISFRGPLFQVGNGATTFNFYSDVTVSPTTINYSLSTGKWYHVVITQTGTTLALYVNGVGQTATGVPAVRTLDGSDNIGSYVAGRLFNGTIDEVRIYNRALTAAQVATLYNATKATHVADTNTTSLTSGLVGYWPLDGNTTSFKTNTTQDLSGQGNTGSLINLSTTTSPVAGKIGGALQFNGSTSYIQTTNSFSGTVSSISGWIYVTKNVAEQHPFEYTGIQVWITGSNKLNFYSGSAYTAVTPTIPLKKWTHIVVECTSVGHFIYVNGALASEPNNASTCSAGSGAVRIGNWVGGGNYYFNGTIDDVRIYNRALSPQEVKQLYALGSADVAHSNTVALSSGLVGYWPFDGNSINWSTNTFNDISGNGNNATSTGISTTTSPVAGKIGQALKFDGSTSYLNVLDSASLQVTRFTISAWIYLNATSSSWLYIVDKGNYNTGLNDYAFTVRNSTLAGLTGNGAGYTEFIGGGNSTTLTTGTWYHAVMTYDGSNIKSYLNGVLQRSLADTRDPTTSGQPFTIGRGPEGRYFPGKIDDVRIYNRALSSQEVSQLYLLGK